MKKDNLTKKNIDDLVKDLNEAQREMNELSFTISAAHRDVKKSREIRKKIARLKTELGTRTLA